MAANLYTKDHPHNNYFSDLIMIHMSLGLGVKYGKAVALASLVSSLLSFVPDRESVGLHLNIFIQVLLIKKWTNYHITVCFRVYTQCMYLN